MIAAALNNPQRARISDPRKKRYKLEISCEADQIRRLVKALTTTGVIPRTVIHYDAFGEFLEGYVTVYAQTDQQHLFGLIQKRLAATPRTQLEDLVLARGPLPNEIRENIYCSADRGRSPAQIAGKMNELGEIAGMGGACWTPQKIKKILSERDAAETAA